MTSNQPAAADKSAKKDTLFAGLQVAAVVLCVLCCIVILLIPTTSLAVDTVYQGF